MSLLDQYLLWPELLREGFSRGLEKRVDVRRAERILVCGMGGSGAAGDLALLVARIYGSRVSIDVVKDFSVGFETRDYDLALAVSYSGNTIETISCLSEALAGGVKAAVLSSGGLLREIAERRGLPWIPLRSGLKPRAALPAMLGAILGVLASTDCLRLSEEEVESATARLERVSVEEARAYAEAIAESSIVTIASTRDVSALAERWRSEIAENSKKVAKVEVYPESAHNDLNSWLFFKAPASFIVIEGWSEYSREALRIASRVFKQVGRTLQVSVEKSLAGVLETSLLAGYSTVLAAQALGLDPAATPAIDAYRGELEKLWRARRSGL
ncbi:MAG: SIS domain-containing protein [Acidilobaceae archaeon]